MAGWEKAKLLVGLGAGDKARSFDALPMHEAFLEYLDYGEIEPRLPKRLGRFDRLVSCFPTDREDAEDRLADLCGARESFFLPVRPPEDYSRHLTDLWAHMLRLPAPAGGGPWCPPASGQTPLPRGPRRGPQGGSGVSPLSPDLAAPAAWPVPDAWRRQAAALLVARGIKPTRPFVAIHPGAGAQAKCWPLERFVAVASASRAAGTPAVFVLGPVELERWGDAVVKPLCEQFPVVPGPDLSALAGLLSAAACYVGNDSGASHLAAAVGTPTVALFGPTDPRHFRPLGRCVRVVAEATMDAIEVADVVDAIEGMSKRG